MFLKSHESSIMKIVCSIQDFCLLLLNNKNSQEDIKDNMILQRQKYSINYSTFFYYTPCNFVFEKSSRWTIIRLTITTCELVQDARARVPFPCPVVPHT